MTYPTFGNVENTDFVFTASGSAVSSLTCNAPPVSLGQTLIAVIAGDNPSTGETFNTPSGWSLRYSSSIAEGQFCIFEKVSDGTEASVTASWSSGTGEIEAIVFKVSGVDSPAVVAPANAARFGGSSWLSPTITTPVDECLLFVGGVSTGGSSWATGNEPDNTTLVKQQAVGTSMWLGLAFMQFATAGSTAGNGNNQWANTVNSKNAFAFAVAPSTAATPTISSGTPTGTLATTTTATIGATTNQNTGTLYTVLSTSSSDLDTITGTQIKAGQIDSGSAAPFSGNNSVSTTSPTIAISGLTDNTTYYYATIQNNTNGDSNILTGSFTTALATRSVNVSIVDGAGSPLASTAVKWWVREDLGDAASSPNAGTSSTNGSGVLGLTGLTVPAGAAVVTVELDSDSDFSSNYYVTLT